MEIKEKNKQEKKIKIKLEKNKFIELINELIKKKLINCKTKWNDIILNELMYNDERYKLMKLNQSNKIQIIFNQKINQLKYQINKSKKIFKNFIKLKENQNKMFVINDN
eukprot:493294_1